MGGADEHGLAATLAKGECVNRSVCGASDSVHGCNNGISFVTFGC